MVVDQEFLVAEIASYELEGFEWPEEMGGDEEETVVMFRYIYSDSVFRVQAITRMLGP